MGPKCQLMWGLMADIAPVSPAILASVDAIENSRAERERQFVKQACAEMSALTSIVLAELGRNFASGGRQSALSFLQETTGLRGMAEEVNIRIQASRTCRCAATKRRQRNAA